MFRWTRGFVVGVAVGVGVALAYRYWQQVQDRGDPSRKHRRDEPADAGEPEAPPTHTEEPEAPPPGVSEPEPPPPPAPEPVEVKGVRFADPAAVLALANGADGEALAAAGLTANAIRVILAQRPFASVEALAATKGIGKKTLETLRDRA